MVITGAASYVNDLQAWREQRLKTIKLNKYYLCLESVNNARPECNNKKTKKSNVTCYFILSQRSDLRRSRNIQIASNHHACVVHSNGRHSHSRVTFTKSRRTPIANTSNNVTRATRATLIRHNSRK